MTLIFSIFLPDLKLLMCLPTIPDVSFLNYSPLIFGVNIFVVQPHTTMTYYFVKSFKIRDEIVHLGFPKVQISYVSHTFHCKMSIVNWVHCLLSNNNWFYFIFLSWLILHQSVNSETYFKCLCSIQRTVRESQNVYF